MKSGGGATFMITFNWIFSWGVWEHAPPETFWYFRALRQLMVQSEAKQL